MSCDNNSCGTGIGISVGTGNMPLPSDPSNNASVTATGYYGGIVVHWTLPTLNPFAIAYTRVRRGTSADFNASVVIDQGAAGTFYRDEVLPPTPYFYWIEFVSINGAINDPIGPASAVALLLKDQTLQSLTGEIDASYLAQWLKAEIDRIALINTALLKEIQDRLYGNTALSDAMKQVQNASDAVATSVLQEITQRKDANSAIVTSINNMFAQAAGNAAALEEEKVVRASKDEALSQSVIALVSKVDNNYGILLEEQTTRATKDSALAQNIIDLQAQLGNGFAAAIHDEQVTRANADGALAQQITTVQASFGNQLASVQTTLQANIDASTGAATALFGAKVEAGGLIGGFGLYNDSNIVDAGFDVDRFWIGRTNNDRVKPFIVSNGIVYIDQAIIRNADIGTLKIGGNAVTIPISSNGGGAAGTGIGQYKTINQVGIYLDQAGTIFAECIASQVMSFLNDSAPVAGWAMYIDIDGQNFMSIGGNFPQSSISVAASGYFGAGGHTVTVHWAGSDTSGNGGYNVAMQVASSQLFVTGTKR